MGRVAAPGKGRTVLVIQERFAPCLALLVNGQLPLQLAYVTFLFSSVVTVRFYLRIVKVLNESIKKPGFLPVSQVSHLTVETGFLVKSRVIAWL